MNGGRSWYPEPGPPSPRTRSTASTTTSAPRSPGSRDTRSWRSTAGEREDILKVRCGAGPGTGAPTHLPPGGPSPARRPWPLSAPPPRTPGTVSSSPRRSGRSEILLTEQANEGAIRMFGANLKPLLMQPPVKGKVTMGLDPGYRNGCKVAVVDRHRQGAGYGGGLPHPLRPQEAGGHGHPGPAHPQVRCHRHRHRKRHRLPGRPSA